MGLFADFQLNRKTLSSYYVSAIISTFFFELVQNWVVRWSNWVTEVIGNITNAPMNSTGALWVSFILACFLITLLIRRFIIAPLGFFIDEEGAPGWETTVLTFLILGFYLYQINQIFSQPMPNWIPTFLVRAVGGFKTTVLVAPPWQAMAWFWNIGPIFFMFVRTKFDFKD